MANGITSLGTQVYLLLLPSLLLTLVQSPPSHPKPRDQGAGQHTHLAVYHLGMLEDGNDVAHHSHAQLIHDLFVEIQQHALLDPVGEGQQ